MRDGLGAAGGMPLWTKGQSLAGCLGPLNRVRPRAGVATARAYGGPADFWGSASCSPVDRPRLVPWLIMASDWVAVTGFITTAVAGVTAPIATSMMSRQEKRRREMWLVIDEAVGAFGRAVDSIEDCFVLWSRGVPADSDEGRVALRAVHAAAEPMRYALGRVSMRLGAGHPVVVCLSELRKAMGEVWGNEVAAFEDGEACQELTVERSRASLAVRRDRLLDLVHQCFAKDDHRAWPTNGGLFGSRPES